MLVVCQFVYANPCECASALARARVCVCVCVCVFCNRVMKELLMSVRELISVLYKLSEIVSTLDMLLSCAHACTLSSYG